MLINKIFFFSVSFLRDFIILVCRNLLYQLCSLSVLLCIISIILDFISFVLCVRCMFAVFKTTKRILI